ncbi:Pentatricopeptide repeat-containing protein, chloroplastic, partial [Cucurbita argyrosperma subsp. argyrosperma]
MAEAEKKKLLKLWQSNPGIMARAGVSVAAKTFKCLLQVYGNLRVLPDGKFVHHLLQRTVRNPPGFLQSCAFKNDCYCGSLSNARRLFDEMLERDLVSWFIMISAYAQIGLSHLGNQMLSQVFKHGLSSNASIETAVMNMYVKCGWLEAAELVFDMMTEKKNKVAWIGLMVGYSSRSNELQDVLSLFGKMVRDGVCVFDCPQACSALTCFDFGTQVHGDGFPYLFGESAMTNLDTAAWIAVIFGYGNHGYASESLRLFIKMQAFSVRPNAVTFILAAIQAWYPGNACWVVAGSTRTVGKTAAENPPSVESRGHSISHVTMFNSCTAFGKWQEAAHVRKKMAKNLKKELSCSCGIPLKAQRTDRKQLLVHSERVAIA